MCRASLAHYNTISWVARSHHTHAGQQLHPLDGCGGCPSNYELLEVWGRGCQAAHGWCVNRHPELAALDAQVRQVRGSAQ